MTLRIAFDLDGVLADMGAALKREERRLFGSPLPDGTAKDGSDESSAARAGETDDQVVAELKKHGLTGRQQRQLWQFVAGIEDFWETLVEIEPGAVSALAQVAASRRWELMFLTKRPATAGATAQLQTQRWLKRHGLPFPSVFVVDRSRGKIADALGLDVVVDDLPENCVDVLSDSKAKAILVWRGTSDAIPASARRLGIGVTASVAECLEILAAMDDDTRRATMMDRVKWVFGLAGWK